MFDFATSTSSPKLSPYSFWMWFFNEKFCLMVNNNKMKDGQTALMVASENGHLDVVNRLVDWQQTQFREGFKLACIYGSLHYPVDLIELVVEFAV